MFSEVRFLKRLGIGIAIGIVTLWWLLRDIDKNIFLRTITTISPFWILVSVSGVVGVALVKGMRWHVLYPLNNYRPTFFELFPVLMMAQTINITVPIRMGELMRVELMKSLGYQRSITLVTIIAEKSLDIISAGLVTILLFLLTVLPDKLQDSLYGMSLVSLVLMIGLVLVWQFHDKLERNLSYWIGIGNVIPISWQRIMRSFLSSAFYVFKQIFDWKILWKSLFWTTVVWFLSLLAIIALAIAFGFKVPVVAIILMVLAIGSSNIAPSPPMLIGIIPFIAVVVLGQYGVSKQVAIGFGVVLNIVTVAPLLILGAWSISYKMDIFQDWLHNFKLKDKQG